MLRKTQRSSSQQVLSLCALVLATSTIACATGSDGGVVVRDAAAGGNTGALANEISRDEIAGTEATSQRMGELLRQFPSLRVRDHGSFICVEFKRAASRRGAGITQCPRQVAVVVDGVLMANPETYLPALRPRALERMRFLQPSEATSRYGANGGNGALLIFTREPGR